MLTIITKRSIVLDPTRIFLVKAVNGERAVCAWPRLPRGVKLTNQNGLRITPDLPEKEAEAFYNRIADQVAAGVTVIDLRKMMNEEGE